MKGPRPGISAQETRTQLVDSGADVLALKGWESTTVNEVARQAGLTSGAVYAHFPGKAELLRAVVSERGGLLRERWDNVDPTRLLDVLERRAIRRGLPTVRDGSMLIEAIVAARRDPGVARTTRAKAATSQKRLRAAIDLAKGAGSCDPDVSSAALARLSLVLTLGSILARSLKLPDVDPDEWTDLIHRLMDSIRTDHTGGPTP
jgi:AcrR family transcriptional regulator